jgi:hypothetical protein
MPDVPSDHDPSSQRAARRVCTDGGDDSEDGTPADAPDADAPDADAEFAERLEHARDLLTEDATACYVGVVRDGREVDSTFAQKASDAQQEGMQALSLLASHLRLVADEAGVDYETVAGDAVTLAERLDESP